MSPELLALLADATPLTIAALALALAGGLVYVGFRVVTLLAQQNTLLGNHLVHRLDAHTALLTDIRAALEGRPRPDRSRPAAPPDAPPTGGR